MPKISQNKLDKSAYDFINRSFIAILADLHDEKDIASLLDSLLTQTERLMLAKRLAIAVFLERELSYKKISNTLKVSSVTIGFVRNSITKNSSSYTQLIKKIAGKLSVDM